MSKNIYTKKLGARVASSARLDTTKKYHVVSGPDQKWTVVADGKVRATRVFDTKSEAVEYAVKLADKVNGGVVIHSDMGEVEERI